MRPIKPIRALVSLTDETATEEIAGRVEELSAYAKQLERALAETREARRSGGLLQPAQKALSELDRSVSSRPEAGPPGTVHVRLIGRMRDLRERPPAPLSDASVRLKVGERVVDEARTDAFGVAALTFPERKVVDCDVEVVGTDGKFLARERLKAGQAQQLTTLLEIAPTNALAGPFARAEAWIEARRASVARLEEWRPVVESALARQEEELTALLEETRAALARCQATQGQGRKADTAARGPEAGPGRTTRSAGQGPEGRRASKPRKNAES